MATEPDVRLELTRFFDVGLGYHWLSSGVKN